MRIGIVGYGYIGRFIAGRIAESGGRFETAFVHNRSAAALADLDPALRLDDLDEAAARRPDLIVECAHPSISARYGEGFLRYADYMPLSVTALADDAVRERLEAAAAAHGTRLVVPAGALLGGDELLMRRGGWDRVRITFRKHPDNLDFSESGLDPASIDGEADDLRRPGARRRETLSAQRQHHGDLRPGLDRPGRLRGPADRRSGAGRRGRRGRGLGRQSGGLLRTEKRQPAVGVSGTEMLTSTWYSILRAAAAPRGPIELV